MPRITVPLAVNYDNITRPVSMAIARDVMKLCAIDQNTPVYMPGEFEKNRQPGSDIGVSDSVVFESYQRMLVQIEENIRNESVMQQVVRQNELPPILEDRYLGISVRPVYMQSDITINFRYVCSTRQQAIRWRDDFAARRAENRTSISHEISYDIPLHDSLIGLLAHLHSLRENVAGYGESFDEYFKQILSRPISSVGTLDGNVDKLLIVVPEKQAQITGWFDFTEIPKETKQDGNITWEIQFSYKVMYHRCTHLYVTYPLLVHQQHIDAKFFSSKPRFSVEELPKSSAIGIRALDVIDGFVDSYPPPVDGFRIPYYDEWIPAPRAQPLYTLPVFTCMLSLDPKDPTALVNLSDFEEFQFTDQMMDFFKQYHRQITLPKQSPVLFTLFADDVALNPSLISIDEDLNVVSVKGLNLRRMYHLRLSLVSDILGLSDKAIEALQKHPEAALQIFHSLLPSLDVQWAMENAIVGDRLLSKKYILWFYKFITNKMKGSKYAGGVNEEGMSDNNNPLVGNGRRSFKYAQYLSIITSKRDS